MIAGAIAAAFLLGAAPAGSSAAATSAARADEAPANELPAGAGQAVLEDRCVSCHGPDYVTQQRLTPGQWQRTIAKMRTFGAVLSDEDARVLTEYLAKHFPVGKPESVPAPVTTPAGAVRPP